MLANAMRPIGASWVKFLGGGMLAGLALAAPAARGDVPSPLNSPAISSADRVEFNRDIRPILASNCFACHGADASHREGELRLDLAEEATANRDPHPAVVPGNPNASLLIARILSDDLDQKMPPPDSGKKLTEEQIETLRAWISQGAHYQSHWSFTSPQVSPLPKTDSTWGVNPIDSFALASMESQGLRPSPTAAPGTWIRRLFLDLIGIPPEPEAVDSFVRSWNEAGTDSDAQRRVRDSWIEQLLASPHYGEKWGREWLDAARYADSDGFEKDKPRTVWFYRDWVIRALNDDKPYDEFLIEQLAGDLLPNATQDQIVATGFLRNSMINEEGGVDPEQFRMEAMYDRMDAIGKAMLGLTIQCAQCHSHKYDPISHTEYYRLFAFLNNFHEGSVTVYTADELRQRSQIRNKIAQLERELQVSMPDWRERMEAWNQQVVQGEPEWHVVVPPQDATGDQKHYVREDGSILAAGYAPTQFTTEFTVETNLQDLTAFRLELLNDADLPHLGPGRSPDGLCALSDFEAKVVPLPAPGDTNAKSAAEIQVKFKQAVADVNPPEEELHPRYDNLSKKRRVTGPISFANDGDDLTAWGIDIGGGRSNVPRQAVFTLDKPLHNPSGFRITFFLEQFHGGWNSDDNQNNNLGRFRFSVTNDPREITAVVPRDIQDDLRVPVAERTPEQQSRIFSYWRTTVETWKEVNAQIEALWKTHPRGTSQLVALERTYAPRRTHRLERGDFLKRAEPVAPGVPAFLHPLGTLTGSPTRLDFARWLASRESPTVARAIVNRIWQSYFGKGLVETSEDLGTQGALPSHPELLDWLAVELMENQWSLKHLHRLISRSAVYGQASEITPGQLTTDPYNRWLSRGPRLRLPAELVRDMALAVSGLLQPDVGGPSVYPPAPEFLFQPPASYGPKPWPTSVGKDKYRRALYTFRFRSVPYPMLQNFDSPNADVACVRRPNSNTPIQALTTMNEPLFLECAAAVARMTLHERPDADDAERIQFAFTRCVGHPPDRHEQETLLQFLRAEAPRWNGPRAEAFLKQTGTDLTQIPAEQFPQLATWTSLGRVLLNLDETITKE